jgi:hypothetical protein
VPDSQLTTQQAALRMGALMITSLIASKLRFFKTNLPVSALTTKASMVAAEADYSGYPAGGYALAAWVGPGINLSGGAAITSPSVNVLIVDPDPDPIVGNTLYGWWIEDATGNVRQAGKFDPPRGMNVVADQFPWIDQIVLGKNPTVVEA